VRSLQLHVSREAVALPEANHSAERRGETHRWNTTHQHEGVYDRAAQVGFEYRQTGGSGAWKEFLTRFITVRAQLDLEGSETVRKAFTDYINEAQRIAYIEEQEGYESEIWEHYDENLGKLTGAMRDDLVHRFKTK
jgi:hypothetical protein